MLLFARDSEMCTVEGAAIEHERGLGRGRLLEVNRSGVLRLVVLDLGDLTTESVGNDAL